MNKIILILLISAISLYGQFKKEIEDAPSIKNSIVNSNPSGFILDFLSSDSFKMNHSVSMSYSSFAGNGVALGVYTNSMAFKFGDQVDARLETSFVNSPYSSFGSDHQNSINGIYISRAQLNYRPTENTAISIQYRQLPAGVYSSYGFGDYRNSYLGDIWAY